MVVLQQYIQSIDIIYLQYRQSYLLQVARDMITSYTGSYNTILVGDSDDDTHHHRHLHQLDLSK